MAQIIQYLIIFMRSKIPNYNNYVKIYKLNIIFSFDKISFLWKKIFFSNNDLFFPFFFFFNTKQKSYDENMQCSANQSSQKRKHRWKRLMVCQPSHCVK